MTKPLLERLDAIANSTGFLQFAARQPKRRPLRGLAMAALLLGTVGMIVALFGQPMMWVGEAILMAGFALSVWLPIMGPIKPWLSESECVDERDEAIRANAYLAALPAILIAAVVSLVGLPWLAWVQHRAAAEMLAVGGFAAIYLVLLWNAIPTLHASLPRPPSDGED